MRSITGNYRCGRSQVRLRFAKSNGNPSMKIRIPHAIAMLGHFCDWGDVDVAGPVRRIDVLLAGGGTFSVGYYGMLYGWLGALQGGSLYLLIMITCLFMNRGEDPAP